MRAGNDAKQLDRFAGGGLRPDNQLLRVMSETIMGSIKLLDVVALLEDIPERGLRRGQVGTVVEPLARGVFEVEFSDNDGRAYATLALRSDQLMILHHDVAQVA